jgi:hypothetical protein
MLIFDHLPTKLPKTAQEVAQGSIFVQRDLWAKWVLAQDMFLLQKTTFVHNAYLCMETLCQFKVDSFKKTFKLVFDNYCHQILTKRGKLWNTL